MIVLGLTGSIGMGKSTTAAMLETLGVPVHEADAEVHALLQLGGKGYEAVREAFPPSRYPQVYEGEALNRKALGAVVFHDDEKRLLLESLLHPLVQQAQQAFIRKHKNLGVDVAVLDIPLLFETGGESRVDYILVVTAPPHIQRERVLSRPGMDEERFEAILKRQIPDGEKCTRADYVVQTGLGRAYTMKELKTILTKIGEKKQ